ncbi:unnamed protein product [Chrysoparadoxa australica]
MSDALSKREADLLRLNDEIDADTRAVMNDTEALLRVQDIVPPLPLAEAPKPGEWMAATAEAAASGSSRTVPSRGRRRPNTGGQSSRPTKASPRSPPNTASAEVGAKFL